jgi:hypothetical protein
LVLLVSFALAVVAAVEVRTQVMAVVAVVAVPHYAM